MQEHEQPQGYDRSLRTDSDVEEILKIALRKSGGESENLRQRLELSARELGISPEVLEEAEREHLLQRAEAKERAQVKAKERGEFYGHLFSYLAVCTFLAALNLLTSPVFPWFLFPVFGWGISVALQFYQVFVSGSRSQSSPPEA